jgi:hypothetical protein
LPSPSVGIVRVDRQRRDQPGVPWPVYVTVVWGAILAFIVWRNRTNDDAAIERELERMDRDS